MPEFVLSNVCLSVRKHGFVCLLLFVLSLFSTVMAANSMMSPPTSNMSSMQTHDMSSDCASTCMSAKSECHDSSSEHGHQDCVDNHCSSFSGLLVSNHSGPENTSSVYMVLPSKFYASTYLNTPYFPPIVIS
ncbi:hypothetical protein [Marinomonas transparens]|uniref:Uncharacterized protein n=1 Tax=Marinomonas transparens TaxID=2795388 RepID=A0A934JTZ1_9GAMM|nr:hypothetical protein [Marinomonas transparens]MBJ7539913.1 hypothetical protein [Marinomonas transparens]